MERLTHQAVTELLSKNPKQPAVTIYCPMHKSAAPPHMTEEQIRLKNLIHKAVEMLKGHPDGRGLEKALCDMLEESLNNQQFWEAQTEGLLICAQPALIRLFHLPVDTEEYVAVDDNFHLAPVLGMLQEELEFYVLAVSRHDPKLFKGDMYGLYETGLELPQTPEKALNIDEVNQKSEHARSAAGPSQGPTGFHGRGGARDPRQEDQARFLRIIDHMVCTHTKQPLPLILAGTDNETAEYRSLSKYRNTLSQTIPGSFSGAQPQELYGPAYEILRAEIVDTKHHEIFEEYETLKGANPDRVATTKDAIAEAAEQGRIDKLLIGVIRTTTDTVRDTREAMARITFPEIGLSTIMNRIANQVWQTSGKIVGLDANQMPNSPLMVARLRY